MKSNFSRQLAFKISDHFIHQDSRYFVLDRLLHPDPSQKLVKVTFYSQKDQNVFCKKVV